MDALRGVIAREPGQPGEGPVAQDLRETGRAGIPPMIDSFFALREGAYPVAKLPGVQRVVLIGDSFLFGAGVPVDDALPAAAERRLSVAAPGRIAEVLGLARRGAALVDFPAYFQRFLDAVGPSFSADLVVVVANYTDGEIQPLAVNGTTSPPETAWRFSRARWRAWSRAVARLKALATQVGARLAIAYYDHLQSPGSPDAARALVELSRRRGAPFIDLWTPFRGESPTALRVSDADEHPNAATHDRAAQHLIAACKSHGLLSATGDSAAMFDAWLRAALRLGGDMSAQRYKRRVLDSRSRANAVPAIREACRNMLPSCDAALRDSVRIDAVSAAVRHWSDLLTRVRPWDCTLEFSLAELDAVAPLSDPASDASGITGSPSERIERVRAAIAAIGNRCHSAAVREALLLLQQPLGVLQHIDRLVARCRLGREQAAHASQVAGLVRVATALLNEFRIEPLQRFLDAPPLDIKLRLELDHTPLDPSPRTLIVNWQPDLPLRALARESVAVAGKHRQSAVFDLPWAASGQLSFGASIGEVQVHAARLSCAVAPPLTLAPGDCVPHRRVRWIPPLDLLEPVTPPAESPVWSAISAL